LLLFKIIRKGKFDIVHTYFFLGHVFGAIGARLFSVKTVIANREDSGFYLHARHFFILRMINKLVDKIIPIAGFAAKQRQKLEKFPDGQYQVIHNGIELSVSQNKSSKEFRKQLSLGESDYVAVTVANMNYEIKGYNYLLDAVKKIKSQGIDIKFLLVGDGVLKQGYINQAKKLGIMDRVFFLGYRDDVQDLLLCSNLFVLPSLTEALSIAILEAMRAKLPIVATRVGGNPEIITDGVNGSLVPSQDGKALADAIIMHYSDKVISKKMAERGYINLVENFSLDNVTRSYWQLYTTLTQAD
jgi:glycosyltransferase involved in cell wall biosynthesis